MRIRYPNTKRTKYLARLSDRKLPSSKEFRPVPNFSKTETFTLMRYDSTSSQDDHTGVFPWYPSSLTASAVTRGFTRASKQKLYGSNQPGYRMLIRKGVNATTSADNRDVHQLTLGGYQLRYGRKTSPFASVHSTMSGCFINSVPDLPFLSLSDQALDDRAKSNFIRKARKAQSSAMTGEVIHDLSKSIASFHRTREIFLRALRVNAYKSIRIREQILGQRLGPKSTPGQRNRSALKALANNWLEFSYGIAPTISDLQDIGFGIWRGYSRTLNGVDNTHVTGWAESTNNSSSVVRVGIVNGIGDNTVAIDSHETITTTLRITYYGGVRTLVDQSATSVSNTLRDLGLGISSFVPTLWEIIPYSFLVDYFTNIGQIVSASSFPRSDILWISRSARAFARIRDEYVEVYPFGVQPNVLENQFQQWPVEFKVNRFQRSIFMGGLTPSFRWHLPYRGTDWLSMLSLIAARSLHL